MSFVKQPLAGLPELDRTPHDLDGLLRAFFRAQVPEPWPVLKPPATLSGRRDGAAPRRRSLPRSRLALVASVLILLIGQFFLSGMFSGDAHFGPDADRGTIEATHRIGPVKVREPKPAPRLKQPEMKRQPRGEGVLIPGRP